MPRIKFDFLKVVLPQLTIQKTKHYFPEYQCRKKLKISFNFNNTNVGRNENPTLPKDETDYCNSNDINHDKLHG